MKAFFQLSFLGLVFMSCADDSDPTGPPPIPGADSLVVSEVFEALDFVRPVDVQHHGDENLYVVEQRGVIQVFDANPQMLDGSIFLDIRNVVDDRDNEEGLLGLAFHPNFDQTQFFYVNYTTANSTTRISRFQADPQNSVAIVNSESVLIEFTQPFGNHNGGQLAFGPDGYLYIAVGDGGSGGDPLGHGQNTNTLLGSILRIDVDNPTAGQNYGIPADNPFAGSQSGDREEIFAYGLRNPWRMSFDTETGQLWAADVGQNTFEEIDIIENGYNYGWKVMEAVDCFQENNCDQSGMELPYFYYGRSSGVSVTGGYVYRGSIASLKGKYIYADYSSGRIWALETGAVNPENELLFDTNHRISTFGIDHQQELYFCSLDGSIFKIEAI